MLLLICAEANRKLLKLWTVGLLGHCHRDEMVDRRVGEQIER